MRACVLRGTSCARDDRCRRNDVVGVYVTHVDVRCCGGVLRSPEDPKDPPLRKISPLPPVSAAPSRSGSTVSSSFFLSSFSSRLADGSGVRANERALMRGESAPRAVTSKRRTINNLCLSLSLSPRSWVSFRRLAVFAEFTHVLARVLIVSEDPTEAQKWQQHLSLLREQYVNLYNANAELQREYAVATAEKQEGGFVGRLLATVASLYCQHRYRYPYMYNLQFQVLLL